MTNPLGQVAIVNVLDASCGQIQLNGTSLNQKDIPANSISMRKRNLKKKSSFSRLLASNELAIENLFFCYMDRSLHDVDPCHAWPIDADVRERQRFRRCERRRQVKDTSRALTHTCTNFCFLRTTFIYNLFISLVLFSLLGLPFTSLPTALLPWRVFPASRAAGERLS